MKKLIVFALIIVGCGGGGGGGGSEDKGTAPEINTVQFYKMTNGGWVETLWFEIGDEVNMDIYATDPDLDIINIHIVEYFDTGDDLLIWKYFDDDLPTQQEENYHYFFLNNLIVEGPVGNWRQCVYVVDAKGNESREVCLNTIVTD